MSAAAKHTPGPWHYDGMANATLEQARRLEIPFMIRARGCSIAEVIPQGTAEANAALIAAAPDLLAALERADEMLMAAAEYLNGANPFLGQPDESKHEPKTLKANTAAARRIAELIKSTRAALAKARGE